MAKNKYINNLIRLLNPNGSKAETTPLNLFDQTIQNPHTLDIPNHQILITIPDGLTIVSQQTGEFGTTTKFSDGTIIFVPTQQQIQLNYYNVISSDNTVDIESSFDGDTTTFDLSANMPEGLTIISQLDYGGSIVTTFSDGTMIVVPKATPTYTHYSPNKSVIITQDDINHTVTYEVAKTETPTQTDHITSVIESDYPIDGETEVTDLDYIQRAGQPITDTTSYWPIADIELAVYADTSITVTLQPDNPNAYSSLLQEATIDDGVYIKARLFGDIITNQPTT